MKSRVLVFVFLFGATALAQRDVDTSGRIDMTPSNGSERVTNDIQRNFAVPIGAVVSASDLGIPARAQKELKKANESLRRQDLAKALERLKKAVALYPSFAVAYNNLGVVYARLGDNEREREALHRAINIDDHFALAYVNLGRVNITADDYPSAEIALSKASTLDPTEPVTLILLAYSEFMDRRFDDAVATSRQAHALARPHAVIHRVAARALEQQKHFADAIAELDLFLAEEPVGPHADAARHELEIVRALIKDAN